jgi:phosphopantothenoylcysteine decarboxylase/phosphopantothenate--cysteine ligase
MNTNMFEHPAVMQNLETLRARGVRLVDPGEGYLACGWIGKGRLAEPEDVVAAAEQLLQERRPPQPTTPAGSRSTSPPPVESTPARPAPAGGLRATVEGGLAGRNVLITAGPTFEDIDPVRFVGNRSSGRMGYALAETAARRGAVVTLVTGPTSLTPPDGVTVVKVRGASDMHLAVMQRAGAQDAIVMAAAVADYTPTAPATEKLKKSEGPLTFLLDRTKDILGDLGKLPSRRQGVPVLIGFAAETSDVVKYAQRKLLQKGVDMIVANDVSRSDAGFDVDTNAVTLVSAAGNEEVPLQAKSGVAARILDRLEIFLIAVPARNASAKA